jgi:uncharacterized lipoprotein YmbA
MRNGNPRVARAFLPALSVESKEERGHEWARHTKGRTIPIALALLLTGCSFFSRSQSRFYSIDPLPPAAAPAAIPRGLPVTIDGLELPPGFDRREVLVRKPDHEMEVRSAEQWSASLQPLVLHTLAFDLASRLPEGSVILPGEAKPTAARRAIDVVFEDFSAGPEARVVADVRLVIHTSGVADLVRHDRIEIPIASTASAEIATGMSRALAALADRIATALATP